MELGLVGVRPSPGLKQLVVGVENHDSFLWLFVVKLSWIEPLVVINGYFHDYYFDFLPYRTAFFAKGQVSEEVGV